jgi:hypothetical protein
MDFDDSNDTARLQGFRAFTEGSEDLDDNGGETAAMTAVADGSSDSTLVGSDSEPAGNVAAGDGGAERHDGGDEWESDDLIKF